MTRLQQTETRPVAYDTELRGTSTWMTENLHQSSLQLIPDYLKVETIIRLIGMINVT